MKKNELSILLGRQPLETARVTLQPMTEADFPEYLSHTSYAAAVAGSDMEETFKEKCRKLLSAENILMLTARQKGSGEYVGFLELSALDTAPELGIELTEAHQRQGLGYEICHMLIDRLFRHSDVPALRYCCLRSNIASLRLAKKLGAAPVKEVRMFEDLQSDDLTIIVHEIRRDTL